MNPISVYQEEGIPDELERETIPRDEEECDLRFLIETRLERRGDSDVTSLEVDEAPQAESEDQRGE